MKVKTSQTNKIVELNDKNFKAFGGEADVYVTGGIAYKIFRSQSTIDAFIPKIKLLSNLSHLSLISPKELLVDNNDKKRAVGFTMPYLSDSEPLTKLMTKAYKMRNNIEVDSLLHLILNMREVFNYVHSQDCVIGDGNDKNILVQKRDFTTPYFIDVDSYKTPNSPSTAYTPLITDPLIIDDPSECTPLSDWYSFAIVTFQLLSNIHPFKGKHPDYTQKQTLDRMKNKISIFNSEVQVPTSSVDIKTLHKVVPPQLFDWYISMFTSNSRSEPPQNFNGTPLSNYNNNDIQKIVLSNVNGSTIKIVNITDQIAEYKEVEFSNIDLLRNLNKNEVSIINSSYFLRLNKEIGMIMVGKEVYSKISYSTTMIAPPQSSKLYRNVVHYPVGNVHHFIVGDERGNLIHFTPQNKNINKSESKESFNHLHTNILDCKYEAGVLVVSVEEKGNFKTFIFRQDESTQLKLFNESYTIILEHDQPAECNFSVLRNNGVIVLLDGDGNLIITSKQMNSNLKVIKNSGLPVDGLLCSNSHNSFSDNRLLFQWNSKLYHLSMN